MNFFDAVPTIITDLMTQNAKNMPKRTALIHGEQHYTWEELNERINKAANEMYTRGIQKGDKVAVLMPNRLQTIEIMFGIIKAGGVLVPLSTMLESETLLHMIEDSEAKMLCFDSGSTELIRCLKPRLSIPEKSLISVGFNREEFEGYEGFIANASVEEPGVQLEFEDECILLYSSGTTGVPKGILHTHYSRFNFAMNVAITMSINQQTRTLVSTPVYSNATWVTMLPTLIFGGTIISMPKFDPYEFLKISQSEKPTHTFMVPTQYHMILNHSDFDQYDVFSYRTLASTGAPLHKNTKLEILDKFQCELIEFYGLTEGIGSSLLSNDVLRKPDSVGVASIGQDIRIIDDQGKELPKGEIGEIVGYGNVLMKEYYKLPEKTKETMWKNDKGQTYLKTGDIGKFDEDGYLYILDRKKDMIVSGGLNIYAADIEKVLATHPHVLECAVIGVPHEKWGETPLALVLLKSNTSSSGSELKEWVNQRVSKFQRVSEVELVESFPRNAMGKILKRTLRNERNKVMKS